MYLHVLTPKGKHKINDKFQNRDHHLPAHIMGKPSLNIERCHPAFAENHKKNSKKTKSRKIEKEWKIFWFQAEDKVKTKKDRKIKAKIIDKSRQTKRKLKSFESGHRTPAQEWDAYNSAMNMEMTLVFEDPSYWTDDDDW